MGNYKNKYGNSTKKYQYGNNDLDNTPNLLEMLILSLFVVIIVLIYNHSNKNKELVKRKELAVINANIQELNNIKDMYIANKGYSIDLNQNTEYVRIMKKISNKKIKKSHSLSFTSIQELEKFKQNYHIPHFAKSHKEIVIAVLDTGINSKIPNIKNYIYNPENKKNFYGYDLTGTGLLDDHGHGTNVSGIILGVNPYVKILPIKSYNPMASGFENLANYVRAIKIAVALNVDIINFSGGGPQPSVDEYSALKEAERKGIILVSALGNDGQNIRLNPYYPASYNLKTSIVVANYDKDKKQLAEYSNFCDINCNSIAYNGTDIDVFNISLTGTSQATPFITGAISILLSQNNYDIEQIKAKLYESSDDQILKNKVVYGLFDFQKFYIKNQALRDVASYSAN